MIIFLRWLFQFWTLITEKRESICFTEKPKFFKSRIKELPEQIREQSIIEKVQLQIQIFSDLFEPVLHIFAPVTNGEPKNLLSKKVDI